MLIKKGLYYPTKENQKNYWLNNKKVYKTAQKDPIKFWDDFAKKEILWQTPWTETYQHSGAYVKWFLNGKLNITENIFEKNFEKIKNKPAIIWEPEPINEKEVVLTYAELLEKVNQFASALKKLGVKKGEVVAIYMPMIPQTLIAMLALARIGAVHAVIFSAFSPSALKYRLENLKTKVVITADGYYRKGKLINLKEQADQAIAGTSVEKLIIAKRANNTVATNPDKDFWFDEICKNEDTNLKAEVMDSEDLLFVLPESGTSGQFLPVMHTCGGYTTYATFTGKAVFNFSEKETLWCTSDPGWITGHTYTIYAPLLNGATTVIYEGAIDFPTPSRWADIIEKHKATIFYTAPTAIRMLEKQDPNIVKNRKFETLTLLGSVGEAIDEPTWMWYFKNIGKEKCAIVDTWWQTETGGIVLTSLPGIGPFKPSFAGLPMPGVNLEILDENKKPCKTNAEGNLVILPPFPPAILRGIYNNEKSYIESYWSQYGTEIYFTSDAAIRDENGLIKIVGRTDDTLKIAGHRISTGEIENAAIKHANITESAVIGVPDELKGETAVIFVICKDNTSPEQVKQDVVSEIRKEIGPIAQPKEIFIVSEFPKTKSGKTMRGILKKIYLGQDLGDLAVVANPETIEKIRTIIQK